MFIDSGKFNWSGRNLKVIQIKEKLNQCKWFPTPQLIIQSPLNTPRETFEAERKRMVAKLEIKNTKF